MSVIMLGCGSALPRTSVSNDEIVEQIKQAGGASDTSSEWIKKRMGISSRHRAQTGAMDETTVGLAQEAASIALQRAGIAITDIDRIIVATVTPDTSVPQTASRVYGALGGKGKRVVAYDVNAGCSGFLYALEQADMAIRAGKSKNCLVIGSERLSSILALERRTTAPLFGDGAGALILSKGCDSEIGIQRIITDGIASVDELYTDAETNTVHMDGTAVFKFAIKEGTDMLKRLLEHIPDTTMPVRRIIAHQANQRIIDDIARSIKKVLAYIPTDLFFSNIDHIGNTSAASIPICIDQLAQEKSISRGERVLLVAFGAGLSIAGVDLLWTL